MSKRKQDQDNLRGRRVTFVHLGRSLTGQVITRIRGTRWQVHCDELPEDCKRADGSRRITLDRSEFTVSVVTQLPRRARTPIERMIDRACGFDS